MDNIQSLVPKKVDMFAFLLLVALLGTMLSNWYDNTAFRLLAYGSEIILIGYTLKVSLSCTKSVLLNRYVIISGIVLLVNFLLSPYEPRYPLLLKYFGYVCCFGFGSALAKKGVQPYVRKIWLYAIAFIPLVLVAVLDTTAGKTMFFANSNVFVFLGLSVALFFNFFNGDTSFKKCFALLILLLYMLVGTSLGVLVAFFGAIFIINFKWRNLLFLILGGVIVLIAVHCINIPVFVRIKDTIAVYQSMDFYDWTHFQDVNLNNLQQSTGAMGEREDNTSSIWRLVQWSGIFTEYITSFMFIPFGLGADFSIAKTGLPPHNDYLLILAEYGLVVFSFFVKFVKLVFDKLKGNYILHFILAIFLYYFTENLIDSFPQNVILYFVLGYLLSRKACLERMKARHGKKWKKSRRGKKPKRLNTQFEPPRLANEETLVEAQTRCGKQLSMNRDK